MQLMVRKTQKDVKIERRMDAFNRAFQVAYNNWGHITLRWFNRDNPDEDVIIVLDAAESNRLIDFIKNVINTGRRVDP